MEEYQSLIKIQKILSGFLEGSNVKSVDELVNGIEQSRAFEINVKFITIAKRVRRSECKFNEDTKLKSSVVLAYLLQTPNK